MNNKIRNMALGAALLATTGQAAFAVGTDAGTSISNSIDVSYTSGGETVTVNDADTATFIVDRRVDLALEGQDASNTVTSAAGADDQVLTFLLTNEGNDGSGYDIDISNSGTLGLTYDINQADGLGDEGTYYTVLSTDATFDPADTFVDLSGNLNDLDLAEDGSMYILIVTNTAGSTVDALTDEFTVSAVALDFGTTTISAQTTFSSMSLAVEDTVLADDGNDGIETDQEDLVITAPQLSFSKSVLVIDNNIDGSMSLATCGTTPPNIDQTAAVPGSCLEYEISVTNAAAATASADGLNYSSSEIDVVSVSVSDSVTGDEEVLLFSETGPDTGVFTAWVET